MTTFGLVHGAWHVGSCWLPLAEVLRSNGHEAVTVDLPCDDPSATFDTYADHVVEALEGLDGDVVLVGHSMAGHTIPLVAARRPVRHLVFLCALMAQPGHSLVDQMKAEPDMLLDDYLPGLAPLDDPRLRQWVDHRLAAELLYGDCDPDATRAALGALRPQALTPYGRPCSLEAIPDVDRTYVLCTEDRLVNPAWSRRAAVDRLGVEAIELPGGHSPFIARPHDLASILQTLV